MATNGTFLKGKSRATLFVAIAHDGNSQIYPVAYGITNSENNTQWEWFMEKFQNAIGLIEN